MFLAMLSTETNTFSPIPTGLNVWRDMLLVRRSDSPDEDPQWPFVDQPLED
jgi:microcystin degradation protein MlrC